MRSHFTCRTGFCAIWDCISSNSSSSGFKYPKRDGGRGGGDRDGGDDRGPRRRWRGRQPGRRLQRHNGESNRRRPRWQRASAARFARALGKITEHKRTVAKDEGLQYGGRQAKHGAFELPMSYKAPLKNDPGLSSGPNADSRGPLPPGVEEKTRKILKPGAF